MKKNILIKAIGGDSWIGGLYYTRNMIFQFLCNDYICSNYNIFIYTEKNNDKVFQEFHQKCTIIYAGTYCGFSKKAEMQIIVFCKKINYIFPLDSNYWLLGVKKIFWIPDFQHKHYPQYFTDNDCNLRDYMYQGIETFGGPLVLSSNDSLLDYEKYYHKGNTDLYVVHFVSYIEQNIRCLNSEIEANILEKFNISNTKYACIMNQFWQHKNHLVVLNAIKLYFQKKSCDDFKFVFTGRLDDYRSPEYIEKLKKLFDEEDIKKHSVLLGFIDRNEQIAIMKNAEFIIQPSLFEGWGTVVEDAKVLDKTILLSDIPVHREQMNEKCVLFDPQNPEELAELIQQECHKEHHDNIEKGIEDMKKRAFEYSKGFEQLLRDQEKIK